MEALLSPVPAQIHRTQQFQSNSYKPDSLSDQQSPSPPVTASDRRNINTGRPSPDNDRLHLSLSRTDSLRSHTSPYSFFITAPSSSSTGGLNPSNWQRLRSWSCSSGGF
ncbi:hypothetical protein NL676_030548 [Syzygium grande]|nr:hypothetical protein NL676_030548 [Syzygium grande]